MTVETTKRFSFDDVLLCPQLSSLGSRSEVDISSKIADRRVLTPIVSSPMDTITDGSMARFMWEHGGFGIVHRYLSISDQYAEVKWAKEMGARLGASIGINGDTPERAEALVEAGADLLVLDIAHGHSLKAIATAKLMQEKFGVPVSSGNIATGKAARDYFNEGITTLRVGIGPGASCSTRVVAGVGVPQLSAILEIKNELRNEDVTIIADGGIKNSGDIVKALAAGADIVMVGGLFAGYDETAGDKIYIQNDDNSMKTFKRFRGMASSDALEARGKQSFVEEGKAFMVPVKYELGNYLKELHEAIQTGLAYLGAKTIPELWEKARFIEVSPLGFAEGLPRGVE